MRKLSNTMGKDFFGLNIKQVNDYFSNLEKVYQKEMEETKENIDKLTVENDALLKELKISKHDLNVESKKTDFFKFALTKAESEIIPLITEKFEVEEKSIRRTGEREELEFDKEIYEIKVILKNTKNLYKNTLISKDTLISKEEVLEEVIEEVKKEVFKEEKEKLIEEVSNLEEIKDIDRRDTNSILDFWGIELKDIADENSNNIQSFNVNENVIKAELSDDSNNKNINAEKSLEPLEKEEKEEKLENKNEISIANKDLSRKITNVRSKYLIGKIVGEDLMNSEGTLIASKNSVITEKLIDTVNREGNLAELIVNMIFPESSE